MSPRRLRPRATDLSLFLLSILTWSAPALAEPQGEARSEQPEDYFRQGKSLVRQGRLEEAYRAYLAGFRLRRSHDFAGNLGNVELELGKPRDAAEHLAFCLRSFPATGAAKQLEFIRGRLAEARKEVGAVLISVSADGAEIFVDAQPIGRSPLPEEVFVDPGSHTIEARLHGHELARQIIEVDRGATVEVVLSLRPVAAPEVLCPPPPPLPPGVAMVIGLSGVAFGVGVGLTRLLCALLPAERPGRARQPATADSASRTPSRRRSRARA